MMREIAIVPMRGPCRVRLRHPPAANHRIIMFSRSLLVQQIRKFRAAHRIGRAGILGVALLLLSSELLSQTAPEGNESAPDAAPPAKGVYLKYYQADWRTILNKVAEQSGSTAIIHEAPEGYHTKHDRTPYTRNEAVQILNRELEPDGFRILESNQYLILMHQRSARTHYRRPERPTQPEFQADRTAPPQFEEAKKPKRSVTAIATKDTEPPAPIQLVEGTKPIPVSVPAAPQAAVSANPIAAPAPEPTTAQGLPEGWEFTTLTPRNKVRDLAGSLYKALQTRAELVDSGVNGLPAFRVQFPSTSQNGGLEGYEVGIDQAKNQMVLSGAPKKLPQLTALFQYLDRESNAFQQPIQLIAADDDTARLAEQLTPQLKRAAREVERQNAAPASLPFGQKARSKPGTRMGAGSSSGPT